MASNPAPYRSQIPNCATLLGLPGELRNKIYRHYFDCIQTTHFIPTPHRICNRSFNATSPECSPDIWNSYARLFYVSTQLHRESRSLFIAEYIPLHRFYFADVSELAEFWRLTGGAWVTMEGSLEYDIRMAITSLPSRGRCTHWLHRGQRIVSEILELVSSTWDYESTLPPESGGGDITTQQRIAAFSEFLKSELGQESRFAGRCDGRPFVIDCGNGRMVRFWWSGSVGVANSRRDGRRELPFMFMEGNLGSLPFLGEMVALGE